MSQYSIEQFSQITGLNKILIRTWENRYGFIEPKRTSTNIRFYDDDMLIKGIKYATLVKNGYKISKLVKNNNDYINNLIEETLNSKENNKNDIYISRFLESAILFDQEIFNKNFSLCVKRMGIINFYKDILVKIMSKISILYLNKQISPANEHFISENIRIKISHEIEKSKNERSRSEWILFLPENEYHDIGLLFANLLLAKKNHKITYLGQNVPRESLLELKGKHKNFLTFLNTKRNGEFYNRFVSFFSENFRDSSVYIIGKEKLKTTKPSKIKYIYEIDELINLTDKK